MFIRRKFVTNSSSTSFVAFGSRLEGRPWGKDSLDYEEWFKEKTGQSLWDRKTPVELFYSYAYEEGALYIKESQLSLEGFCGISHSKDEPKWTEQLQDFCKKLGIFCEPTWFAWYSGG